MNIALCTPFKPLNHPKISGDVTIARDLAAGLAGLGHTVNVLPHFPARLIWERPSLWPGAFLALGRMVRAARGADCWLTYGSYYKVPDVFGPGGARRLGIPYFIFQASYAQKRGQRPATWPGYRLNRRAMLRADHVFLNRAADGEGCAKLLPAHRFSLVRPGLPAGLFARDEAARDRLRAEWAAGDALVVATVAMMRPGVKVEGLRWVVETCAELVGRGRDLRLVVAGDGPCRAEAESAARERLGDRVRFLGRMARAELAGFFSAADLFAFPGLRESVGMAYLEAQACGLPVVATDDEGAPQVVAHERSGLICPADPAAFTEAVDRLAGSPDLLARLAAQAPRYVVERHDLEANYRVMAETMQSIVAGGRQ
ncbi:glycosyltransferase family 4 protein [Pseudodesulfovibrio sp.]|uniref:glycosyltransferase family 4 protein n=1 Tax=Pseudodesulfovibrio sp. TaxID=2035812 RepID=UPI00261CE343|nr:glycosyltransferase family 4 protein [Pseudodesulfovibrio sp.]MDD3312234.1 glycosyltransferase family 4 protein [Pseudodesulfovibrio sp.]